MPSATKPRGRPRKSAAPKTSSVVRGRKRKTAEAASKNNSEEEEEASTSTSPRRRTPRRSVSKANYKDSDSDEAYVDDDDDDSVVVAEEAKSSKPSTRRKNPKRTPAKKKKASKKEEEEDYKDDGDNTNKSGDEGDKTVTSSAKPSKRRRSTSTRPHTSRKEKFLQLKPGDKCITKYGVVEIISDDQLPADHHKSKVTDEKIKAAALINRQNDRFNVRKTKLADEFAAGARHRRHELQKIYLDSISSNTATTQDQVWKQYCTSITPEQILVGGKSWGDKNKPDEKKTEYEYFNTADPRAPLDFYPDRIVKCKLVKDERSVIDVKGPKKGTTRLQYIERDPVEDTAMQLPITLHLSRRELTRAYDPEEINHICSFCGEGNFKSRTHAKYHIDQGFCTDGKLQMKEDAEERTKAVEKEALSGSYPTQDFLSKMHAVVAPKANTVSYKNIEEFGNPCKIKPSKRDKMPPWIVFNEKRSPLYPEMYIALGFRRGSQNRNFYNKQKLDDDYVPRGERRIERKRRKRFSLPGSSNNIRQSTHASRFSSIKIEIAQTNELVIHPDANASLPSLPPMDVSQNSQMPSLPPIDVAQNSRMPSLPPIDAGASQAAIPIDEAAENDAMDVDFGSNNDNDNDTSDTGTMDAETQPSVVHRPSRKHNLPPSVEQRETSVRCPELGEGWIKRSIKRPNSNAVDHHYLSPDGWKFRGFQDARNYLDGKANKGVRAKGRRKPSLAKTMYQAPKPPEQVNNAPLQPVIIDSQVLADECVAGRYPSMNLYSGDHDDECNLCQKAPKDDSQLLECDFCKNSVHQVCLNKAMLRKEPPVVVRETEPHDSQMCHECLTVCINRRARAETRRMRKWQNELRKAGLDNIPDAVGLTEEVNLKDSGDDNAGNAEASRKEVAPLSKPCPTGGPGGLVCCSYCNAAYSRLLSNTAKEMEAQSVARKGQEVSEILELLADAKQRLRVAADLSRSNDQRRNLLRNNEA